MFRIYNNLTRQKEEFVPIESGKVRMYVCGMTVYDYCHLGHARVMVVFDVVARYLRQLGYELTYVRNITDIDDKIIARAKENVKSISVLTDFFIEEMHKDERDLGVLPPDHEPRATDTQSMDAIIAMIEKLEKNGFAYVGANGDVFFAVLKFPTYGKLSGKQLDELRAGERVEIEQAKRDPLDFVLWKLAKPGEPSWESPWGQGRPGWHIECSAMSTQCLGNHFDIHGGGMDLQFPHHENEIAQSEGASGQKFVNYWMHNGFVRINEEKMSKSLGNFFTVREVKNHYRADAIRLFILSSHYRSPLNYADSQLEEANSKLRRLYTALRDLELGSDRETESGADYRQRFHKAMCDDFNTPIAIAVLFDLAAEINRQKQSGEQEIATELGATLKALGGILGLLQNSPGDWLQGRASGQVEPPEIRSAGSISSDEKAIEDKIKARELARTNKDWQRADQLRDQLLEMGIILEDSPTGTLWRRK